MSKEVGARIRETRQKAGLSQAALAAKTEGISASVLSKAERGEKELSPEQLQALAAALEVAPEALTGEAAPCECQAAPEASETPCECRAVPEAAEEPAEMTEEEKEVVQLFQSADAATQNAAISALKEGKVSGTDLLLTLSGMLSGGQQSEGGDVSQKLMAAVLKLLGIQGGDGALKLVGILTKLGGSQGDSAQKNPLEAVMNMVGGIMGKK